MNTKEMLSTSWLNGEYNVCGYSVSIITSLSFAYFEKDEQEYYVFQGDEGNHVIDEINVIYNTYTCELDAPTVEQAIEKWISINL